MYVGPLDRPCTVDERGNKHGMRRMNRETLPPLHLCPIGTNNGGSRPTTITRGEGSDSTSRLQNLERDLQGLIAQRLVEGNPCERLTTLRETDSDALLGKGNVLEAVIKTMREDLWLGKAIDARGTTLEGLSLICKDLAVIDEFFKRIPTFSGHRRHFGPMSGPNVNVFMDTLVRETGVNDIEEVMDYVILMYPRVVVVGYNDMWTPMKTHFSNFRNEDSVIRVVSRAPHALMNLGITANDNNFKKNKKVVLAAVEKDGSALRWANYELKKDIDVVKTALRRDSGAFEYVDPSLREDPRVIATIRESEERKQSLFTSLRDYIKRLPR